MNARQLISDAIVPLKNSDSAAFALAMMEGYHVSHLPITDETSYVGLISEADLYAMTRMEDPLAHQAFPSNRPFVVENQHILEVIKAMSALKLTILPVLTENDEYAGVITISNLFYHVSGILAIDNPGGIIILEVNEKDYLLTEIAQIVESNDAKILNMYITTIPDQAKMEVTLKLNRIDVGPILQTFSRYNYSIKATYTENTYNEGLRDRYDSLMKYLNV